MVTEADEQRRDLVRIAATSLAEAIRISDRDREPDLTAVLTAASDALSEAQRMLRS